MKVDNYVEGYVVNPDLGTCSVLHMHGGFFPHITIPRQRMALTQQFNTYIKTRLRYGPITVSSDPHPDALSIYLMNESNYDARHLSHTNHGGAPDATDDAQARYCN